MTTHSATTSVASQSIIVHPDNVLFQYSLYRVVGKIFGLSPIATTSASVSVLALSSRGENPCGRRCPTEAAQDGLRDMLGAQRRLVVAGPAQQLEAVA